MLISKDSLEKCVLKVAHMNHGHEIEVCFPVWPISIGPTLCQDCIAHHVSGSFNSGWWEIDKWL